MEFYKITTKNKDELVSKSDYDLIFSIIKPKYDFSINNKYILVKVEDMPEEAFLGCFGRFPELYKKINISKIIDIDKEIDSKDNLDWIEQELFIERSKIATDEIIKENEKLDNIIKVAQEKFDDENFCKDTKIKKGGEASKWQQIKEIIKMRGKK